MAPPIRPPMWPPMLMPGDAEGEDEVDDDEEADLGGDLLHAAAAGDQESGGEEAEDGAGGADRHAQRVRFEDHDAERAGQQRREVDRDETGVPITGSISVPRM